MDMEMGREGVGMGREGVGVGREGVGVGREGVGMGREGVGVGREGVGVGREGVGVGREGVGVGEEEEEGVEGWIVMVARGTVVCGASVGVMEGLKMFTVLVLPATPTGEGVTGAWTTVGGDSVTMGTAPLSSASTMIVVSAFGSSAGCKNVTRPEYPVVFRMTENLTTGLTCSMLLHTQREPLGKCITIDRPMIPSGPESGMLGSVNVCEIFSLFVKLSNFPLRSPIS